MEPRRVQVTTRSAAETAEVGTRLGRLLVAGDVLALTGDLGAGKTCLVQGLARGLEVPEEACVRSPTFVVLNQYPGRVLVHHMDMYRIAHPDELEDLGPREIFYGDGVTAVEWADKIREALPPDRLDVDMAFVGEGDVRRIVIEARGGRFASRWDGLLESVAGLRGNGETG